MAQDVRLGLGAAVLAAVGLTVGVPAVARSARSATKAALGHGGSPSAEQLFRDGRDSFKKPDYTRAKRSLERAVAVCASIRTHAAACAELTVEASLLLGRIYESQNELPEAMLAFQRVLAGEANPRGKSEQRAYAQNAIARLRPQLGQVIVTEKKSQGCHEEAVWLHPGTTQLRLNGNVQAVNVRAGQVVQIGSCE